MGGVAMSLPTGVKRAAEWLAIVCEQEGLGGIVANVGVEDGLVLWISFTGNGVRESFVRLHDGSYTRSAMFEEAFDGQLPDGG